MTDDVPASQRWRGRPVQSLLLQAFVFAVPIVASVAAATLISAVGPRPQTLWQFVLWWAVLTMIALAVLVTVDRLARKLLPLATLLKLSMLFPDRAPSRFRVARNAASVRKLSEQLAAARERGLTAEPVWAAETVLTLITALGHHDRRSRGHSERVHVYAELLADELDLDEQDRDRLRWAALLHDIGKLVVPSELLNKPGTPDDREWDALRTHPEAGAQLCAPLLPWLGEWGLAIEEHHEWFDGTGYPKGLSGMEISRAARIVAVADCYEVMTTSRTYKRALSPAAAREELAHCAGTQFDPGIVRAFLNISLGRLRLAMGPLALLSTVPSMARLASAFESLAPVARAGAVVGGAAVLIGGGAIAPGSGGTAGSGDVAEAVVVSEPQVSAVAADRDLVLRQRPESVWSSSNPPPAPPPRHPEGDDDTDSDDAATGDTPNTARADSPAAAPAPAEPPRRRRTATPKPTADSDSTTTRSAPDDGADAVRSTKVERTRTDNRGAGGGAHPTPPTSPPGQSAAPPPGPPADPAPPRSPRAGGKGP